MKKGFLLLCCLFSYINLLAQGSESGCLLPDNQVYTEVSGSGLYKFDSDIGVVALSDNYCSWTPSSGIPCTVCIGGDGQYNGGGNCVGAGRSSVSGSYHTFTMVPCSIDNYIAFLILCTSALGFFYLGRKKSILTP